MTRLTLNIYHNKQLFVDVLQNNVLKDFAIFTGKHLLSCVYTYFYINGLYFKGICVSRPPASVLAPGLNLYLTAPGPNLYFTAPALNLYLPASALNFCSPVLRFACSTVKVCYSYSVYLCKLSVYLYVLPG